MEAKVNNCKAFIFLVRYLFQMSVGFFKLFCRIERTLTLGKFYSCGVEVVNDYYRGPFFYVDELVFVESLSNVQLYSNMGLELIKV